MAFAYHGIAREVGELTRAALLYPLGCTALGSRALMRILVPATERAGQYRTPVILVHGYGSNPSIWFPLQQRLLRAGFAHVYAISYNAAIVDVPAIGRILARGCAGALHRSGTDRVHLVGHSLGGVVVRHAVQRLGLAPHVRTAVTVATPHRGIPLALSGWGTTVRFPRPGSRRPGDRGESTGLSDVRWINFYSDHDLVVRPSSARSRPLDGHTGDILVPQAGHIGILRAPAFLDGVVRNLLADEQTIRLEPTRRDPVTARRASASHGAMSLGAMSEVETRRRALSMPTPATRRQASGS